MNTLPWMIFFGGFCAFIAYQIGYGNGVRATTAWHATLKPTDTRNK